MGLAKPLSKKPTKLELLCERYQRVRARTLEICAPLSVEDHLLQCIDDTSPAKWHLAHTTWFFETFVLRQCLGLAPHDPAYHGLFNSYYQSVGSLFNRSMRGSISRPALQDIHAYRSAIDERLLSALKQLGPNDLETEEIANRVELGLHHEEQHQELVLMDIKRNFYINPTFPIYRSDLPQDESAASKMSFNLIRGGMHFVGHEGAGFAYDNEHPRHQVYLQDFKIASRFVSNAEWLGFIEDGGYDNADHWLSDGWDWKIKNQISAPLYWQSHPKRQGWQRFCFRGMIDVEADAPVAHVSYYEADAFASWCGKRLPTEFEWEAAASLAAALEEGFLSDGRFAPASPPTTGSGMASLLGHVWTLTSSAYAPYPGFQPLPDALGEYNGKFMSGQMVLRGGSCLTPQPHIRASYRNFFYPHQRWAMQGIRLAE